MYPFIAAAQIMEPLAGMVGDMELEQVVVLEMVAISIKHGYQGQSVWIWFVFGCYAFNCCFTFFDQ